MPTLGYLAPQGDSKSLYADIFHCFHSGCAAMDINATRGLLAPSPQINRSTSPMYSKSEVAPSFPLGHVDSLPEAGARARSRSPAAGQSSRGHADDAIEDPAWTCSGVPTPLPAHWVFETSVCHSMLPLFHRCHHLHILSQPFCVLGPRL